MYATFTGFRLGADGNIFCALAASPPVVHWHASAQSISKFEEPQFPVGLLPCSRFDGFALDAATGDLLVVATDGILEVADKHGEEFGIERLNDSYRGWSATIRCRSLPHGFSLWQAASVVSWMIRPSCSSAVCKNVCLYRP